ncbi:MAG TPA: hypothetical protein VMU84_21045 [Thermoanaerobaculia bacterium]|nr:hypothetical protein [Thermoanaerobaculia bacterium]
MTLPPLPRSLAIVGWVFAGFGALQLLGGAVGLVVFSVMNLTPANLPPEMRVVGLIMVHFREIAIIQIALASLMITGAVALLRLKAWGRVLLQFVAWLLLVYTLAFGVYWVRSASATRGPFAMVFVGMGVMNAVMYAIPLGIAIRVLRSEAVRAAVAKT